MERFVFLHFALIFAHVMDCCSGCESNGDCPKTRSHCCRELDTHSKLDCYNISSCIGRYCENELECGEGLCCQYRTCVNELECVFNNIVIIVVSTSLGLCGIFFIVVVVYVVYKFKRISKRRRVGAATNSRTNQACTVLTMPSTYQCTNQNN